jgi:hypothetical protein
MLELKHSFMNKLIILGESSLDKIDNITVESPTIERLLEGVIKVFCSLIVNI